MADRPHEYERRKPSKKKPSKYALSLVGEMGEFSFPEGYESLDGTEMIVREALPGDRYRVAVAGARGGHLGDEFIVERHEFITHAEKKRQAGY